MSNHEVCDKVTEDDYRMPMPKGCPPEIYAIMRKCWQQEPEDRVTFDELVKDITAIMPNLAGGGVALAFLSTFRPHRLRQHHECTRARRLVELGGDGLVGGLAVRGVRRRELARLERLPVEAPEEGVAADALCAAPRACVGTRRR